MTEVGIRRAAHRMYFMVVISLIAFSLTFYVNLDWTTVKYIRAFATVITALGLIDLVTVRSRSNKKNIFFLVFTALVIYTERTKEILYKSFGRPRDLSVEKDTIEVCDNHNCCNKEHIGITVKYRNPLIVFGIEIKDSETYSKEYCTYCINKPTFEIDEEWGRQEHVVRKINEYRNSN